MKKVLFASLLILALLVSSSAVMFVGAENADAGTPADPPSPKFFEDFDSEDAATKYTDSDKFTAKVENGKLSLTPKNTANVYFSYPLADGQTLDGSKGLTIAYTFCFKTVGAHSFAGVATNVRSDEINFTGVNYGNPSTLPAREFWGNTAPIESKDPGTPSYGAVNLYTDAATKVGFEFKTSTNIYTVVIHIDSAEVAAPKYSIYMNDSDDALVLFGGSNSKAYSELVDSLNGAFGLCVRGATTVEFDSVAIYEDSSVDDSIVLTKFRGTTNAKVFAKGLACNDTVEMRFLVKFDREITNYNAIVAVEGTTTEVVPTRYTGELPEGYTADDIIYEYRVSLAAKQMTETVELSFKDNVYVNNASVTETVAAIHTVEDYCNYQITNASSATVKQVCAATLVYGYQAQVVFGYKTDKLPKLTEDILKLATAGITVTPVTE